MITIKLTMRGNEIEFPIDREVIVDFNCSTPDGEILPPPPDGYCWNIIEITQIGIKCKLQKSNTMKELKIEIPEGHEIDTERSTFERIVFRPVKSTLPKTWEELNSVSGYYTKHDSIISCVNYGSTSKATNRNVFAELDQAEAAVALAQLSQLKKAYNGDWVPDWNSVEQAKYVIMPYRDIIATGTNKLSTAFLAFKDAETRDLFAENFRDLIEQAKPLML